MSENDKKMETATFRFGLIAEFVAGARLGYGERARLLREKAARSYKIPHSSSTRVSVSTLKKWIDDYKRAGNRIEGLFPAVRKDRGVHRVLGEDLQDAVREIRNGKKGSTLTAGGIVKELRRRKLIGYREDVSMDALYRFLKNNDLRRGTLKEDRRAFEAEHPNELWQSDVMHGPRVAAGKGGKKSYLIAIMDDHSRLVPHAEFHLSERLGDFKRCLKAAIEKRGLPRKLYIDNGACYKATNTEQVASCLGIAVIHTPPYTPQGRGKVERWFRYVRQDFLAGCDEGLTLEELNERFADWLEGYHGRKHSATGETPLERYRGDMECVRPAPPDLYDYFRLVEFRTVRKDRTFRLHGTLFEAPVNLIDLRVELRYHCESPDKVEIFHDGRSFGGAVLLDKHVNFRIGRNHKIVADAGEPSIGSGELF